MIEETDWQARTKLLLKNDLVDGLAQIHVLVCGLGGVGGAALEHLARAGVGEFTLVDGDVVQASNCNRQILALQTNIGESKAKLAKERVLAINPAAKVKVINTFMEGDQFKELLVQQPYSYVLDAIDTLSPKIDLIRHCLSIGIPLVSSMGAGGKLDPSQAQVADISKTYGDKLARMLRKRLHKFKIYEGFNAVFSPEPVQEEAFELTDGKGYKKTTVGTISYMPHMFGLMCAQTIIRTAIGKK